MKSDRSETYKILRKDYSFMAYEGYSLALNDNELCIVFDFNLSDRHSFRPELRIPIPQNRKDDIIADSLIRNIIFNMGMIELISYWKAACPPKLLIRAGELDDAQIQWWKKLYLNGLGEFFYRNGISPGDDFIDIKAQEAKPVTNTASVEGKGVLIPVGGGKDSVVTLEMLSKTEYCRPFVINSREATERTVSITGFEEDEVIRISRSIDPRLLKLNEEGFLNGHTPFSAMLAFTSLLVAAIYGMNEIALSNESSANEPTIPGSDINHQYSKSLEFEEDFMQYVSNYICTGIGYYSFLRPLNELQISGLFSKYPEHFQSFRSCNVGSKTDSWCAKCPKCLFTYIMLSVFLGEAELYGIFGAQLYEDESLLHIFKQLTGLAEEKPFECVGTISEVNIAIQSVIACKGKAELPALLRFYREVVKNNESISTDLNIAKKEFGPHHIHGREKVELLKKAIDEL